MLESTDNVIRNGQKLKDFQLPIKKHFELSIGDIVERKLKDGDVLLLNRQPTLHKGSMMAFDIKIKPAKTIRTNLAITKSFNADFDGDEMNLHAPSNVETETELRLLSSVENHIISNQSNKANIVIVQDGLLGSYVMSNYDEEINFDDFFHILDSLSHWTMDSFEYKKKLFMKISIYKLQLQKITYLYIF